MEIILITTTSSERYFRRLQELKKYGLLNVGNKKICLKIMLGTESLSEELKHEVLSGWPDGITALIENSWHDNPGVRVSTYYYGLNHSDIECSRWFAKIDDDSVTNISGLIDHLDEEYDHNREYYLTGMNSTDYDPEEYGLMDMFGLRERWFGADMRSPVHEWEISIISQAAVRRICGDQTALKLLGERSLVPHGHGDQTLALAARVCKIYPMECSYLHRDPLIRSFSLFGGSRIDHIHYISHDMSPHLFARVRRLVDGSPIKFSGPSFLVVKDEIRKMQLTDGGFVSPGYGNIYFWDMDGKDLILMDEWARVTHRFKDISFGIFNDGTGPDGIPVQLRNPRC